MDNIYYSNERNIQILISLLKAHHVKRIIVSPGSSNLYFVASIQNDEYFDIYSCVDERSAAYMACGMAAESGEPVVISCTMATAGRNYLPGLTEAFYRKLPILALTATEPGALPGHNIQQVTDRSCLPKDVVKESYFVRVPHNDIEEWESNIKINDALIMLRKQGGGPVHINLEMEKSLDFSVKSLKEERVVKYYSEDSMLPDLPEGKVGIFVGAHGRWSEKLVALVDEFCENNGAVVLIDQCSNYKGKYGIPFTLISAQKLYASTVLQLDLIIHIGEVSASKQNYGKKIWRVNIDGKVRDTFRRLDSIFAMSEEKFFEVYKKRNYNRNKTDAYGEWDIVYKKILDKFTEEEENIPFSNAWVAYRMHNRIKNDSVLHFGILNSLRCWNFFRTDHKVLAYANTGGFGIDGCVSSLIGASLVNRDKTFYGVFGDLAFFYDMNSIGSRHIENNIRIMVVNNGLGFEFKQYSNDSQKIGMGKEANLFIAAEGHYGYKSKELIKHYAENLGFYYISASSKEEFMEVENIYINGIQSRKPVLLEVFTDDNSEAQALEIVQTLEKDATSVAKNIIKSLVKR